MSPGSNCLTMRSSIIIVPLAGFSKPRTILNVVVIPQPDGPNAMNSPSFTSRSMTATEAPPAMLGYSNAAWKLTPRDSFIGWIPKLREKSLLLVDDHPRFLILPWIKIPNLGSHLLAIIRRRLPGDWTERYGTTPVLIETFVETSRYTGAVYRASGWIHVGTTQGRGR